jgi:apolipoprotein N-acyltransferase
VYFAGTLYWITHVMVTFGGLQVWVAILVNLALVAYLALFPAFFAIVLQRLLAGFGPALLMAAPLVWVATELGRTYLFSGFPWVLLGYSQVSVLPIAQLASVVGVYGVSALVVLVNAAVASVGLHAVQDRVRVPVHARMQTAGESPAALYRSAIATVVLLAGVTAWGGLRVSRSELTRVGDPMRVGLVQGNVDQADKWNASRAEEIFQRHLRLTREAVAQSVDVVLWPESSTPFMFEEDRVRADEIRALAREANVSILLGSDEVDRGPPDRYYNSAFVVGPDGRVGGVYRKMHLVPFGEYVPLKEVFFFAAPLVEAVSDFSAGEEPVLLPVNGRSISTAICYEIIYPEQVRRSVADGSELLTTITNDAWFGFTSAPYQHFAQAAMRAIENGRYLVRAANTGISGIVDPYGRVLVQSSLFEPAVLVGEARYLRGSTVYARTGDVFAYTSVAVTLVMLVTARPRRRRM